MTLELNRDNFDAEVLQAEEPVLIDFWGPQCRPCLALMPAVERIEQDYEGRFKVAKINTAENRMLCAKLRVLGLPAFLLYRDGAEVGRLSGDQVTESDLRRAVEKALAKE